MIKEKNITVVGGSKDLFLVLVLWDDFSAASPGIHNVWNIVGWGAKFGSFKHKNLLKNLFLKPWCDVLVAAAQPRVSVEGLRPRQRSAMKR